MHETPPPAPQGQTQKRKRHGEHKDIRWLRIGALVGFALLCPFVGAAKWGPSVCLLALGSLFWLNPPRRMLSPRLNVIFGMLIGVAAAAFLPASWFTMAEWRGRAGGLGIALPPTITPQPWLTLDALLLFLAGLAWVYYLAVQRWTLDEHRLIARVLSGGVLVMAALAVFFHLHGVSLPFWKSERNFGPFLNRNHTANFFALGGVLMMACAYDDWKRSKWRTVFWLGGTVLILIGLTFNYSRSGILIFFCGAAGWLGVLAFKEREKHQLGIAAVAVIVMTTIFLFRGGETLERFKVGKDPLQIVGQDFRWRLQRDALAFGATGPWCGIGLGNFADVFPQFRQASFSEQRALHPDGDWAWLRVSMGWPAVALVLAGLVLLARQVPPLERGSNWQLRAAAAVAGVLFALHGIVNVSGHVLGTLAPAALLISLALHPKRSLETRRWPVPVFRSIGIVLSITGTTWLICVVQDRALPGRIGASILNRTAKAAYQRKAFNEVITLSSRGLRFAPLDWELYHLRGSAIAFSGRPVEAAVSDFRRARFLIPNAWTVPYHQGLCLLQARSALAVEPFMAALLAAGESSPQVFTDVLGQSNGHPALRRALKKFARGNWDYRMILLAGLPGEEFREELAAILQQDPELAKVSAVDRATILGLWAAKGDKALLLEKTSHRSEWQKAIWPMLAKDHAQKGEHEQAYRLAENFMPPTRLPQADDRRTLAALERQFVLDKADFATGYRLFAAQREASQELDALRTLRTLTSLPGCPAYLFFCQAEMHALQRQWLEAWAALQRYEPRLQ